MLDYCNYTDEFDTPWVFSHEGCRCVLLADHDGEHECGMGNVHGEHHSTCVLDTIEDID